MITLYDVLGARADDDADTLKNAFRNAAKASHPDLHAEDPHAVERFRQIVRANAILSDPDQRAVYDHLLAFERWQERTRTRRGLVLDALRNLASDAISVVLLAALLGGGYLVFLHIAASPVDAVQATEMSSGSDAAPPPRQAARQQGEIGPIRLTREELHALVAGPEPAAPAAVGGPHEESPSAPPPVTRSPPDVSSSTAKDETMPGAVAQDPPALAGAKEASVEPVRDVQDHAAAPSDPVTFSGSEVGDAKPNDTKTGEAQTEAAKAGEASSSDPKFYFERGVASYRTGDLTRALADFNQAILLDPNFTSAYVNRSIVLYRQAEVDRAFADVAQATRIQDSLKATTRSHRGTGTPPRN